MDPILYVFVSWTSLYLVIRFHSIFSLDNICIVASLFRSYTDLGEEYDRTPSLISHKYANHTFGWKLVFTPNAGPGIMCFNIHKMVYLIFTLFDIHYIMDLLMYNNN